LIWKVHYTKKTISASRALAELKGVITDLPNPTLFVDTINLQEAQGNYLNYLEEFGFLKSEQVGKEKLYLNIELMKILRN
jgi:hypothetical protein